MSNFEGWRTLILVVVFLIAGVVLILCGYVDVGATLITTTTAFAGMRAITNGPVARRRR